MARVKEILASGLDFAPLRLLGGFICLDTHLGCWGCSYCLNRRHLELDQLLNRQFHLDLDEIGVTSEALIGYLQNLASFTSASVPLRIGHLTDWKYEWRETGRILSQLPADYPVVLMTRYPLSDASRTIPLKHRNVLLHVTLTPLIKGFEKDYLDPATVVASVAGLNFKQLLFMLRPLVADNLQQTLQVLEILPEQANVCFKGLNVDGIPGMSRLTAIQPLELARLKQIALKKRLQVWDFFGCVFRRNLNLPFFKYREIAGKVDSRCNHCENLPVCGDQPFPSVAFLAKQLKKLDIDYESITIDTQKVTVKTQTPTARAEEAFLSELLRCDVQFSTVARSDDKSMAFFDQTILKRWDNNGFYPVAEMRAISAEIRKRMKRGNPDGGLYEKYFWQK